jgi:hypothetical protein
MKRRMWKRVRDEKNVSGKKYSALKKGERKMSGDSQHNVSVTTFIIIHSF